MDVIILGVYNKEDRLKLDLVAKSLELEILWDFTEYNIDSEEGIILLKEAFNLSLVGILVDKEGKNFANSYPMIYEVTETYLSNSGKPKLFQFTDKLKEIDIGKMIISFANEWDRKSLVRVEKCYVEELEQRLNSIFVWCEGYLNLESNTEIRVDDYPLILEVKKVNKK